jgi:hypothetical protein
VSSEVRITAPVVEVFRPSRAPHLTARAAEIEATMRRQLEALPPAALERVMELGAAITRDRDAFARFRSRLGITTEVRPQCM